VRGYAPDLREAVIGDVRQASTAWIGILQLRARSSATRRPASDEGTTNRHHDYVSVSPSTFSAVPAGWIYEPSADDSARFVLGTVGMNPLVCIGVNPSTARPNDLDQTLRRVRGYAQRNQNDSWVMLNLYPQRSTDPDGMHDTYVPELKSENERHITNFINGRQLTLLAAWGQPIKIRSYLRDMLVDIVRIADDSSCDWVSIGDLTTTFHPRHPSRGSYLPLVHFDMGAYLRRL